LTLIAITALFQGATLPDTIVTRQIVERGWLETLVSVEQAMVGLAMLGMLVAIVLLLLALKKSVSELSRLVQASTSDVGAAARAVRGVADDVRAVTQVIRTDVDEVGATVRQVNAQVRAAASEVSSRARRAGALIDVAQEEVEAFVVSTAATLRGIRSGTSVLRQGLSFARRASARPVRHPRRRDPEDGGRGADGPRLRPRDSHTA